ncbi:aminodeoxychorismate lyase PabC [Gottschalkia acidurici 9a]|uniref:Aminodeoxychorismate lyase PabC n=1 Tax=Gottschalkia acidurici (strain ATCC 7906 / DSM 604 / BCRC 14475 / CIP 104303 / KCTC 5404 / NCIMB 10678 / 9a) TaxID=1128398 RepID=K0AZ86_GOTA9|nr:aminotransferase class IV [Gottschalkia acidurici]AFS79113.1 aminodeoxychorismate lyase PabC [Gottschalkia acidurici 9a]
MYILNGSVYKTEENTVSPLSESFMFGYGLFETLKVLNGKILFLEEHIDRLISGCKTLKLTLKDSKKNIELDCYKLLELNQVKNGVLKILYSKNRDKEYLLLTTRHNPYTEENYKNGFKMMFSDIKRNQHSILAFIKSNNYMENLLAKQVGAENGYDEVIFLNTDGFIAEGAASNIFWIKSGNVFTPSTECGLLPGIVRDKVILISQKLDLKINIGKFSKGDILDADEVFITNSVMEIMPISNIGKKVYNIRENNITKNIIKSYIKLIGEINEK